MFTIAVLLLSLLSISLSLSLTILLSLSLSILLKEQIFEVTDRRPHRCISSLFTAEKILDTWNLLRYALLIVTSLNLRGKLGLGKEDGRDLWVRYWNNLSVWPSGSCTCILSKHSLSSVQFALFVLPPFEWSLSHNWVTFSAFIFDLKEFCFDHLLLVLKGFRHGFGMHAKIPKYLWPSTLFTDLDFPHLVNLLTIFFSWFLLRTAHYHF